MNYNSGSIQVIGPVAVNDLGEPSPGASSKKSCDLSAAAPMGIVTSWNKDRNRASVSGGGFVVFGGGL
jgi:hypothetical protein